MHGFKNGSVFLKELCVNNDVVFVQEHWLLRSHLHKLSDIDDNFCLYGKSAMDNIQSTGILTGRPFGGVGVLWRKSLGSVISSVDCSEDGRVVVIKIEHGSSNLLCFGVYLPCYDHSA